MSSQSPSLNETGGRFSLYCLQVVHIGSYQTHFLTSHLLAIIVLVSQRT